MFRVNVFCEHIYIYIAIYNSAILSILLLYTLSIPMPVCHLPNEWVSILEVLVDYLVPDRSNVSADLVAIGAPPYRGLFRRRVPLVSGAVVPRGLNVWLCEWTGKPSILLCVCAPQRAMAAQRKDTLSWRGNCSLYFVAGVIRRF
jgi:hypothetical protein